MDAAYKSLVKQEEVLLKDLQSRKLAEEEAERARKIRVSFSFALVLGLLLCISPWSVE